MSSPAPLPFEIHRSAVRGELQKVVKWLRKGGLVDALCPTPSDSGQTKEAVAAAAVMAAAVEAAAAAAAKVDALEQAMAAGGEGGSSGAADPSEAREAAEVPNDYVCPITTEIMTDPVCTADGFTYERTAISEWLSTNDTSPSTGTTLAIKMLIPNLSLCSMIRSFVEASAAAPSSPQPPAV